ncbi:cytochrome C [Afipia sp. P52-10]|jgi:cytochrome c2|uniref:c-type cytochrome n=1 Tax=Afipia sp. P52-10 TaxID=1429916 RepID=UPI0003DF2185|nr:c-type cytochrome [Afipia sp. P52-10]ETR79262.1 cytochrome C [Afipia sp. P52-10]
MSGHNARMLMLGCGIGLAALLAAGVFVAMNRNNNKAIAIALTGGEPDKAPALIRRYGCAGCHTIGGVPGAVGKVAQPLDGLRARVFIAGRLQNSPDNLVRWIVSPDSVSPGTAMPRTGITPDEARHVAAYLYAR